MSKGFSLFETLIVIFIFSIVMTIFSAAFVASLSLQRRAFNIQAIEENMNFALEAMAKEIRVGDLKNQDTNTPDTNNCASPSSSLSFVHPINGSIVYSLSNNAIQRSVNGVSGLVTSNTIEVTRLQFCVSGSSADAFGNPAGDTLQPRVTILVSFRSTKISQRSTIDVQTTVSQRFLSN